MGVPGGVEGRLKEQRRVGVHGVRQVEVLRPGGKATGVDCLLRHWKGEGEAERQNGRGSGRGSGVAGFW